MPSRSELVVLPSDAMVPLVRAVAALADAGVRRYAVVGGVAASLRLGRAHRATADVATRIGAQNGGARPQPGWGARSYSASL
jgi:hypothetical protein